MRYHEIMERVREAPLYHSTYIENAVSILDDNKIVPGKMGLPARIKGKSIRGVSFTRSLNFAKAFSECILEFDQQMVRRDYGRLLPYLDHNIGKANDFGDQRREAEEFLPGTFNNVSKYLTGIFLEKENYNTTMNYTAVRDDGDFRLQLSAIKKIMEMPVYRGMI